MDASKAGYDTGRQSRFTWSGAVRPLRSARLTPCRRFGPSPCPTHYGERLATTPSADFCPVTPRITTWRAAPSCRVRCLLRSRGSAASPHAWALFSQRTLLAIYVASKRHCHAGQISPNKFMISRCTTAAFTLSRVPLDFVVKCQLAPGLSLLCSFCSSARIFALGLPADNSSRPCPCLRLVVMFPFQVLPQGTLTPSDHAHVGRTL
jgi:hypothetical protein